MKKHQLLALLTLVALMSGQTLVDVRTQTKNVDFSGAASTIPARSGTSLPASCKVGEMFFNTANSPGQNLYLCSPVNTWTVMTSGSTSTNGSVLTGTNGQFAFYAANGSTVSGHTLAAGDIPALNYQTPLTFTGTGTKTASSTGSTTTNDCAKWDANGNIIDAGAPCGSGSGGSAAWASLTSGTNTSGAFILGSGASLTTSGTGTIAATSVPASGVTGLAPSATTDTTNAANISSGTLSAARLPATAVVTSGATGNGAKYASASAAGTSNNCAKWDANGNVVDAGAPCGTSSSSVASTTDLIAGNGSGSGVDSGIAAATVLTTSNSNTIAASRVSGSTAILQASKYYSDGDSITAGYEANGVSGGSGTSYANMIATDSGATQQSGTFQAGYSACDLGSTYIFNTVPLLPGPDNAPLATVLLGTNDLDNNRTTANYDTNVYMPCHKAIIAWHALANKFAATDTTHGGICTNSGTWTYQSGGGGGNWIIANDVSQTNGSTKTCPITTYGGPVYFWYFVSNSNSTSTFTYSVDGGTATTLTGNTSPAINTKSNHNYGWMLGRIPSVSAGTHSIVFTGTGPTGGTSAWSVLAIGTPPSATYYNGPRVYVGGIPKEDGDANSALTAQYNADAQADAALLAGDGLGVYFVNVRNYLCTSIVNSACYGYQGLRDMNNFGSGADILHPNAQGQLELKQAFESAMQFIPLSTSSGSSSSSGTVNSGSAGQFAYYSAAGTAVAGHTLAASDIPALSYDASGAAAAAQAASLQKTNNLSDLASVSTARTNLGLGTAATMASSAFQTPLTFTGTGSSTVSGTGAGTSGNCAKWDANGNVVDAGAPCGTGSGSTVTDSQLPADQCVLTKYAVSYTQLTGAASTSPAVTLFTMPSTSTRICLVEIAGTTSFTGGSLTAGTVRLQSAASTPMVYSPNQDVFGTVGPTTNNYWTDTGNMADRTNQAVVAAFTFSGSSASLTQGSVYITVGTRTMP